MGVSIFSYLYRSGGGFFFKTNFADDELFKVILVEYVSTLLFDDNVIELPLERRRSRSGKIQKPTQELFNLVAKRYLEGD